MKTNSERIREERAYWERVRARNAKFPRWRSVLGRLVRLAFKGMTFLLLIILLILMLLAFRI
jgi:hypothetical protein